MKLSIDTWLKSGRHLPKPLRTFEAQRDVFKAIDGLVEVRPQDMIRRPNWVEAQVYVIDIFLWFMARRGYTLQRTRHVGEFRDLEADVGQFVRQRQAQFTSMLKASQGGLPSVIGPDGPAGS